jgi:hypothetical protein
MSAVEWQSGQAVMSTVLANGDELKFVNGNRKMISWRQSYGQYSAVVDKIGKISADICGGFCLREHRGSRPTGVHAKPHLASARVWDLDGPVFARLVVEMQWRSTGIAGLL